MSRIEDLQDLGLPPHASAEDIKAAYRRLAQEHHPDKPGGNAAKFIKAESAYRRLTANQDEEKLERLNGYASSNIAILILEVINQVDTETVDIISAMKDNINQSIINISVNKSAAAKRITKHTRTLKRCKDKTTIVARVIVDSIAGCREDIAKMNDDIIMNNMMLAKLKGIEYDLGEIPVMDVSID